MFDDQFDDQFDEHKQESSLKKTFAIKQRLFLTVVHQPEKFCQFGIAAPTKHHSNEVAT